MRHIGVLLSILGVIVPAAARAQTYGPYTFSGPSSWATSATETGSSCAGGMPYPSGVCTTNVVGHSPTVCAANLNISSSAAVGAVCSTTEYIQLQFDGVPITNVIGPDVIVFDSRFSTDGLAISVETSPGVFSSFEVWSASEQLVLAPGSGCAGATLAAAPVDLARFGLPPGFVTRAIRVASANAGSGCQADLTMAGVPDGGVVCATDTDCNDGNPCTMDTCGAGGACTSTSIGGPGCGLPNGSPCDADSECESVSCVDGVCCDGACSGQCEACDVSGSEGTCTAVTGAPHGARAACASDGGVCGGSCDGTARDACVYPDASTVCAPGSCADGVAIADAGCDGAGACTTGLTVECAPYVCDGAMCAGECTTDDECAEGAFCAAGMCMPELPPGSSCDRARQCGTALCVDGVCCDVACDGQCEACDVAGSEGTCSAVTGAPHGARAACATDGTACAGACDGTDRDACTYPASDTECSAASCAAGVATGAGSCDGTGACREGDGESCDPYVCGESACLDACDGDEDCVAGRVCEGGECVVAQADAGVPDAGGGGGSMRGGCGCSVPSRSGDRPLALVLGVLGAALALRRRR